MAITFKESRIYVNGAEPSAGQLAGFTKNDLYTPWNNNKPKESGYVLLYVSSSTKYRGYVAGYSGNYYITRLKFNTTEPLKSVSVTLSCTGNDNTNGTYKRGIVATTDSTLAKNYSSFKSRSDLSLIRFTSTTVTVVCDANVIPAGDFYIYIGPGPNDTNGKFSTIFAQQSTSLALSVTGTTADTYTISYNANHGSGTTPSHKVIKGYSTNLAQNNFTAPPTRLYSVTLNGNGGKDGTPTYKNPPNVFYRWLEGSTSGSSYEAGAAYKPSANTTFYAQWYTPTIMGSTTRDPGETDGYTVTLDANGGNCDISSLVAKDAIIYEFNGWNSKKDGSGSNYNDTSTYIITSTKTLYAKWIEEVQTGTGTVSLPSATNSSSSNKTITLDYQGATGGNSTSTTTYKKTTAKAFKGWGISSSATSGITGTYKPSKNITLYAVWGSATYSYSTASLPTPTKTGYTFMGWATSETASSGSIGSFTPTTDDVTVLYAIWEPDGNVRICVDGTYKMALAYIYAPSSSSDTKPWKLTLVYLKNPSSSSDTKPWKLVAG